LYGVDALRLPVPRVTQGGWRWRRRRLALWKGRRSNCNCGWLRG